MSSDVTFRTANTATAQPEVKAMGDGLAPVPESHATAPYTEYAKDKGHSFLLDHYELGHLANKDLTDTGAFSSEVANIDAYITRQIEKGEIGNTTEDVAREIKRLEKLTNVKDDSRAFMRISLVAEYAKFLLKAEGIKTQIAKYGLV